MDGDPERGMLEGRSNVETNDMFPIALWKSKWAASADIHAGRGSQETIAAITSGTLSSSSFDRVRTDEGDDRSGRVMS